MKRFTPKRSKALSSLFISIFTVRFDTVNHRLETIIKVLTIMGLISLGALNADAACSGCTSTITSNSSSITVSSGDVICINFSGTFNQSITINGGTLCIASGVTLSSSININDACTIINYGSASSSITQGSGSVFENYGTYTGSFTQNGSAATNYSGGTFNPSGYTPNSGSFTNNSGGEVTISSATFDDGMTFTNNGTITMGSITINSGATVTLTGPNQTMDGAIMNDGTFTFAGPGTLDGSSTINSGGVMNLSGGVTIDGTVSNNGTINLSGSLTITGDYASNSGATVTSSSGAYCNSFTAAGVSGAGDYNGNNYGLEVSPNPGCCMTNGAGTAPAAPTIQPSGLSLSFTSSSDLKLSYTVASTQPTGYIILRCIGTSTPSDNPVNNTSYSIGATIGSSTVVAEVSGSTATYTDDIPGGSCGDRVYYRIFSYNGSGSCILYDLTSPLTDNISIPTGPTASVSSTTNITCYGASTGAVNVSITGGSTPFTYAWGNGATTQNVSGVVAGTYIATVTDYYGCHDTAKAVLTQPSAALSGSIAGTNETCNDGTTGAATLTVAGGTTTYTYSWSNSATTQNLSNISAGTFTVTITDHNSCTTTASVTITQPTAVSASIVGTNVNCYGTSTGAATLTVSGGTSPYTYHWSNSATTQDLSSLAAGTYSVTVTDHNSCTGTASVTITQVAQLTPTITPTEITCNGLSNGAASVSVSGGTSPYTYSWTGGATTTSISSKAAGTYSITVTDHNSCTATSSVTLTQPAALSGSISGTNISCFGASTGAAALTVSGGTSPYTYHWSNSATTQNLANIVAGTFAVTITDHNACTTTASTTITQPSAALSASVGGTNVNCYGAFTGAANLITSGGTSPYTYSWSNSATTENLSNLAAGTYTVTVTDHNSCTTTGSTTITQPSSALTASISGTNVNCYGASTGAAALTVSGGTSTYSYSWSNSATTQSLSNIAAGTYTVTVTDSKSCTTTASATITQPSAALSASISPTAVNCYGNSTGAATLTVSGGTTAYSYLWSNSATTQNLSNIDAGTFTVTVTDSKSCTTSASTTITQPSAALSASIAGTNVSCYGGSTGAATLTVSGGTTAYSYHWSNSATTQNLTGLAAGTFTVTVTDSKSCTTTTSSTITQPSAALAASIAGTNVNCYGASTGAATLTVSGGTTAYTYSWSNSATTQNLSNIAAGTYTVTVTDHNSCTTTASVTITQPSAALSASISGTNVNCYGGSTGAAALTVSGGTTAYTYSWSNSATTQNLSNIDAGTFTVTVTDSKSCTTTASTTITQPSAALSASIAGSNVSCYGGSTGAATLTVSGGTTAYSYHWSNSATTQNLTGLAAGTFTVTITDSKSCTTTTSSTITQPSAALAASIAGTNVNCYGASTGAATLTVSGGTTAYTYSWSNSATTQNLSNIAAGTYTVTVTDHNSCTTTASVTITQPSAALSASISGTNVNCYGGSTGAAALTVSGGTTAYTYSWSNSVTTQNLSNIAAGTFTVSVTDSKSCTTTASTTITQPSAALSASIAGSNVSCYGGSTGAAALTVSGGTTAYTYSWSNSTTTQNLSNIMAGAYTVTVTDHNSCTTTASATITQPSTALSASISGTNVNCYGASTGAATLTVSGGTTTYSYSWSNSATTQNLSNIAAGTYTVTVTDHNSCTTTASVTITQPSAALSASISGTNVTCSGLSNGAATLTVSGGTTAYTYAWSNNATTQNLTSIAANTFTVTVTDSKSCTTTASVTITQPAILSASISGTNVSCYGNSTGVATLTVSGGTTAYTYLWSNSATTQNLSNIAAGSYTVTVTDHNSCTTTASSTITQPSTALSASISGTNVNCYGGGTGAATLTVSGGTTSYTYHWSNSATTQNLTSIAAGTYSVTVTDHNLCTTTASVTITQPSAALSASISGTNIACYGLSNGAAALTVSGGTTAYSYLWSNNSTTQNLNNIAAGTFTVTVTDAKSCTASASTTITQPSAALSASISPTNPGCNGGNTGSASLTVSGGTTAYSYSWSNSATTQNLSSISAGIYAVTVTDHNSCTTTATTTLSVSGNIVPTISATNVSCNGGSNGAVTLSTTGPGGVYVYSWSNGSLTESLSNVPAGTYTVNISIVLSSCTATASVTVTQPAALSASISGTNENCNGASTGAAALTVAGGTSPYIYHWNGGATTQNLSNIAAGTYTVTVTDNNSCTTSSNVTISQPAALSASISGTNIGCYGNSTGAATLTVSGGTTPYIYHWNGGATTQNLSGLAAGTYAVTVTDNNSCTTSASVTLTQPSAALSGSIAASNINCYGGTTGAASLTVSGGTTAYSYLWSNSSTTQNLTGLATGAYTVTVTDHNSCTTTASTTIMQPAAALSASISGTNITCYGASTGATTLTVSGGTTAYSYLWSNSASTQNLSGIAAGTFTVTVTDHNSCTTTSSTTITQPSAYSASIAGTNVSCNGGSTGSATLTASGGTSPYTYSWSNSATTQNLSNIASGTYTVTVTDHNSCKTTATATITQPSALSGSIAATSVGCYGGSTGATTLTVSGGTSPFTYHWSNSATTQNLSSVAAGTFGVTITDHNSCTTTASTTITQPAAALSASITGTNLACNGTSTGAAALTVSGGTTTYTYLWSNNATTQNLTGLAAGNFVVTVTDHNSCTVSTSVAITQPSALSASISGTNVNCNGNSNGAASLTVSGGTTAYSYSWNNSATTQNLSGLGAGIYTVTVTDHNSCNTTATVTITQPAALTVSVTETDLTKTNEDDGTTSSSVSGGTTSYNYRWSNGATTQNLADLDTGTYTITVTDSKGCAITGSTTVHNPSAPCTCVASGLWRDSSTWTGKCSGGGGLYAGPMDSIVIQGYQVTVDSIHSVKALELREGSDTTKLLFTGTGQLTVLDTFYLTTLSAGDDIDVELNGSSKLTVNTNMAVSHSNGNNINVLLNNLNGTNAKLLVNGNLNLMLNSGGKNILIESEAASDTIQVKGSVNLDNNNNSTSNTMNMELNSSGVMIVNGNINFNPVRDGNTSVLTNSTSTLFLGGSMTRPTAASSLFGAYTASGSSSLVLNGSSQQTLAGSTGNGADKFTYLNLVFNNTGSTAPQFILGGNASVSNSITFTNGIVNTGADTLTIANNSASSLSGYGTNSFVEGYLTRYITTNTSTYDFPVGLGGKYFLASIINNDLVGPSKITATFRVMPAGDQVPVSIALSDMTVTAMNPTGLWTIEPDVQPLLGTYNINLSTTNFTGLYDNFFVALKRPTGSSVSNFGLGNGTLPLWGAITRLVSTGYTQMMGLGSFSDFGIGGSDAGSLPITLLSFSATPQNDEVLLKWATAQEINNHYFTVERSQDAINFDELIQVPGAGSSEIEHNYDTVDTKPYLGQSYYRLRQTDYNGNFTVSDIIPVTITTFTTTDFTIYPNPNKGSFTVNINSPEKTVKLMILNSLGQLVHVDEVENLSGTSTINLNLGDELAAGMYYVKIDSGNDTFVKQMVID